MDEPEKVIGGVSEAEMDGSKPVMEETETDGQVPMEAETGAGEVKDQVQVEEDVRLEADQLVGDNPDSVAQQVIEDTSKALIVVGAQNEEKMKPEESVGVEDKSLAEIDTKMGVIDHDDEGGDGGGGGGPIHSHDNGLYGSPNSDMKPQDDDHGIDNGEQLKDLSTEREMNMQLATELGDKNPNLCFDNSGSDTEEEQAAFVKEVEAFYKEKNLEFKHPKFYKEDLNLLKLWRAVIKLGGYEQVTSCKLWRQVGESFNPPKTCTTVSWTFRIFYEKALLEYEKHKIHGGLLPHADTSFVEPNGVEAQAGSNQAPGSGRAKRDAAARAMRSWHSQRVLDNGEDKTSSPTLKSDRQLKNFGLLKRKKPSTLDSGVRVSQLKATKSQRSFGRLDTAVVDVGAPADWVKINVQKTVDCYEVYALVPGLLREEVVSLPSRIDPHHTSAVVTLHGQLFVRVPFEAADV
ncbi:hypothetical protein ERO13_A04G110800v2 [Gossypium hirsutum]|uniref:ARID domain-containing protein n=3 Tax=Gossypium TaxID=3633 RepID=A0A5D2QZL0_GOSTO|nr:hypothetical protein ERO13_A04G110800v2 [Gossypium hirsutum]TYI33653.1 hypothetical protein ES332_A04G148300v1 [Gossypium tomentosum]